MEGSRKLERKRRETIKSHIIVLSLITLTLLVSVGVVVVSVIKNKYGDEYETKAIANQMNKVQDKTINPNRGSILDRNLQSLAVSSTVYNVALDIRVLAKEKPEVQENTITGICELLGIEDTEIREALAINPETQKPNKDTNWYVIAKKVSYELGKKIQEKNLRCVYTEDDTLRNYPNDTLAAQVIGFLRGDTVWGLESKYNESLIGTPGRIFRTYEADNSITTSEIPAVEGSTLVTTIDQTIQQFAEDAAKSAYESAKPDHVPINTSAIVMNPNTGEVLAMAEYPTFNLNDPTKISLIEDSLFKGKWDSLSDEDKMNYTNSAWKNFNITDTFEPGSIFKPIVIAAAYEEGLISSTDTFYCGGSKVYNGETIHCHLRSGHGTQTAEQVLANSCNVGMMDIVSKLGREKFYKYQRDFGFGERTGIDLPSESSAASLLYPIESLNTVELATSSFGQGFNCTAIQALNAFAAVINGGNLMKPYVVSQIVNKDGSIAKQNSPEVVRKVISRETSDYLRTAMESVFSSTGTGKKASISGYKIGGKTGTAQQGKRSDNIYTLDFISYFPVDDPQYICMVVIHHPKNYSDGIVSPAPVLRELMLNIINYKNIPPSSDTTSSDNSTDTETNVLIKDYTNKSLKDTIADLNSLGIDFELAGSGGDIVTKQRPEGNSKVPVGSSILLFAGTSDNPPQLSAVPDVMGLSVDEAIKFLEASGFQYSVFEATSTQIEQADGEVTETTQDDDTQENNANQKKVYQQSPVAGVNLESGSIVKIKIQ